MPSGSSVPVRRMIAGAPAAIASELDRPPLAPGSPAFLLSDLLAHVEVVLVGHVRALRPPHHGRQPRACGCSHPLTSPRSQRRGGSGTSRPEIASAPLARPPLPG
eukprot:7024424-Pyramimonas_sp.AAC.1